MLSVVIIGFIWKLILSPLWGVAEGGLNAVGLGDLFAPWLGLEGPAIVTQFDSTTLVPPGFSCTVDPVGHLVITYSDEILAAAQQHTTAGAAAR